MPLIRPFKAIIYNKKKIKDITKVVAPPYDVISPALQSELYKKHQNNVVRLILGRIKKSDCGSNNRYTRAKADFNLWLDKKILIEDDKEAVYIYSQKYKYDGKWVERTGFISAMKLDLTDETRRARLNVSYARGSKILPHENTLKAPKADRLNLTRCVKANLSPIFMLYEDDKDEVSGMLKQFILKTKPFIDINIDDIHNRVWKITDKNAIEKIGLLMADKNIFIADGHHRYETAVNYANEIESSNAPKEFKDSSKYTLAYFCKLDDNSLTILPTHRLIRDTGKLAEDEIIEKLKKYFAVEEYTSAKKCISRLKEQKNRHAFGMYAGGKKFYCLALEKESDAQAYMGTGSRDWKNLDVAILHLFVIQNILAIRDEDDNIEFVKDAYEAVKLTGEPARRSGKGKFKIAFLLNPTKVSQIKLVAEHGEKMPRKATYFYPKPLSGLVIRKI